MNEPASPSPTSSIPLLFVYWAVVGIPLAWGVYNTVLKVKVLFR